MRFDTQITALTINMVFLKVYVLLTYQLNPNIFRLIL